MAGRRLGGCDLSAGTGAFVLSVTARTAGFCILIMMIAPSLIFRYLSRHPRPDLPYARPCRDDPGAFPERDRTLTEPRTCVRARRLRAVEVTNEGSVAAPAERQPSGGEVPVGLTVEAGNDTSDLVVVTFNERIHRSGLTLDGLRIRSRRVGGSADVRRPHAASGGSAAAPNRSSNSASRCSASSMPFAFTWPKPRIRSGSDAISTASAWLVWSRPSRSDATVRS